MKFKGDATLAIAQTGKSLNQWAADVLAHAVHA